MKIGERSPNFQCELVTGTTFDLQTTLQKGPVVLNFIMGTWCPFCSEHLKKVREWQDNIGGNVSMIILSSETKASLRAWNKNNPTSYLFASDPDLKIIQLFNVKNKLIKAATPTTILIDTDKTIKMIFGGVRTKKNREQVLEKICDVGNCNKQ